MAKIGRNDPCPCGSGKKYKHCCMEKDNNVIDMNRRLISQDAGKFQSALANYAITHYEEPLTEVLEDHMERYDFGIPTSNEEAFMSLYFPWAIFNVKMEDGGTIFQRFLDQKGSDYRSATVEAMTQLTPTPSVYEWGASLGRDQYAIRDLVSDKEWTLSFREDDPPTQGTPVVGILIPAINEFLMSMTDFPPDYQNDVAEWMKQIDVETGESLVKQAFPKILHDVIELSEEYGDAEEPTYESLNEQQKGVADLFVQINRERLSQEALDLGITVWAEYCSEQEPTIRKKSIHAAALEYLVGMMAGSGGMTQKELADKYQVSVTSISQRYQDMQYIMFEAFEEFMEGIVPNLFGEEEDGEDEENEPNFHDIRMFMEQELYGLKRALEVEDKDFDSKEEAQQFLNESMNQDDPS